MRGSRGWDWGRRVCPRRGVLSMSAVFPTVTAGGFGNAPCENGWIRGSSPRMTVNVQRSACRPGSEFMQQAATPEEKIDLASMVADLNNLLRLKTTVIGMKMLARADEMAAIPKIRRPSAVHTTDQIVSMASRLGWTVGITADDLVGAQCRAG